MIHMSSSEKVGEGNSSNNRPSEEGAVSEIVLPDTGRLEKKMPRPNGFESFEPSESNWVRGVDCGSSSRCKFSIRCDEATLGVRLSIQDMIPGFLFMLLGDGERAWGIAEAR